MTHLEAGPGPNAKSRPPPGAPRLTHYGTASVLLELDGLRILTDPVFDPAGSRYSLGPPGLWADLDYVNLGGATARAKDLGPIDLVLLSHDQHRDNLDRGGLELVRGAGRVLTTPAGAARLKRKGVERVRGLAPWEVREIPGRQHPLTITATPAQHGPAGTGWLAGAVTGFVVESPSLPRGPLYLTGDTVWFGGVAQVAARFPGVATVLAHVGAGRFGRGRWRRWLRFSMNGEEARRVAEHFAQAELIPIHYQGWSHFSEGRADIEAAFLGRPEAARLRWLPLGQATPW